MFPLLWIPPPQTQGPAGLPRAGRWHPALLTGSGGYCFPSAGSCQLLGGIREGGREGGRVEDQAGRRRASTLRLVVTVVKPVSPEKHEGALKTAASPAFFCSPEAREGAGSLLETAPPLFSLKLSSVSIQARTGDKRFQIREIPFHLCTCVLVLVTPASGTTHPSNK